MAVGTGDVVVRRLGVGDATLATEAARAMAETFGEGPGASPDHLARLLARLDFRFYGAFDGGRAVGGLTAHVIPLTREDGAELFIYDIAVRESHQRRGIGRSLVEAALHAAWTEGLSAAFVPADNDDRHALDFYRALGGSAQAVTFFNFQPASQTR